MSRNGSCKCLAVIKDQEADQHAPAGGRGGGGLSSAVHPLAYIDYML